MKNALRAALYSRLSTDPTLGDMAIKGVFHRLAPQGTLVPYVVYQIMTSRPAYTLGGRRGYDFKVMVKVITQGSSGELADQIDDRCDVLLSDQPLTLEGGTVEYIRRVEDIGYPEIDGGKVFHHAGGLYDIQVSL